MAQLRLTLLGAIEISLAGKSLSGIKTDKARALLIYLAVERSRAHRRQALAGLLWPDYPEEGARANLRHALANLRGVLGEEGNEEPFLLVEGETLQLNPESDCWLDAAELDRLAAGAAISDLEAAVALYRGGFLEGFTLKDSPDFDSWTAVLRERYLQGVSRALGKLGEVQAQNGEYEQAINQARKRLGLEPWQEEAHRQLMRYLALNGQRAAALAQYESCQKILKEELGVEPAIETKRLFASIRDGELSAARQAKVRSHNLPAHLTSFIGREKEIEEIKGFLGRGERRAPSQSRLVTLTGSGGAGKTRLALQTGTALLEQYPDGVWLAELAPLSEPELVVQTVARSMGMRLEAEAQALTLLEDYLEEKRLLLILDNCEHLVEACARLADALLKACPHLHILATSREALGIEGEAPYRVPPLAFPQAEEALENLEQYEAVQLFLERAETVSPGFHLTPENAPAVAGICRRLDGIPLALELAAARMKVLRVEEIAQRLDDCFRLLTGGSRLALPRYQTLRASIDWSYDLLSPEEQRLLRRLSVFAGGWVLEAAEYLGCGEGIEVCEVLDLLCQLVNKSLVTVEAGGDETRYGMLETIRQYAQEKLVEAGEDEGVCDRHLVYYVELAEKVEDKIRGPNITAILNRLEAELENLRLALRWSLESKSNTSLERTTGRMIAHGLRLASALLWFWHIRTRCEEGLLWLRRLLATELEVNIEQVFNSARTQRRAKALLVAGWMATELGEFDKAVEFYEEGRRLFQTLGTEGEWGIARIHYNLGAVAYYRGNLLLSENLLEESQAIFAKRGDRFWTSEIFQFLGAIAETKREYHRARMYFEHNLALKMKLGDQDGIADMLYHLGVVAYNEQFQVSDPDLDGQVSALFQESLEIFKKINSGAFFKPSDCLGYIKWRQGYYSKAAECFNLVLSYSRMIDSSGLIVSSLSNLGLLALSQEDYVRSTELFEESLDISLRRDHKDLIAWSLNNIGALACEKGDFDRAKRKYLEALSVSKEIGDRFLEADSYIGICKVLIAQDKFDPVRKFLADALEISQQSLDLQKIFCVLESFAFLAEYEMRTDADAGLERAAILLGATHAWHVKWQLTRTPRERAEREKAIASVREALGEAAFAAAWEEGQAMTLEQAIAYAKEDY